MVRFFESVLHSGTMLYVLGAVVVALVLFATAAKSPNPQCPRCKEVNRPMARYCAHCGNPLFKS